jgi:hypothetical protein
MKPTRKRSPRSFVSQVAGSGGPTGGMGPGGPDKGGAGSDHDLAHPASHGGGNDPDSGPDSGGR